MNAMWQRPRGGIAPPMTKERLQYLEQVEIKFYNLEAEKHTLESKCQKLEEKLRAEQEELKKLQAVDFSKGKKGNSRPHDIISQSLDEIFSKSVDWAREYFKIDLKDFRIDRFPLFSKELEWVLWEDSGWRTKRLLNVSHLVQAVVADRLAMEFFFDQFRGCEQGFQRHCGGLYKAMLEENIEEAHQWRAMTLSAYERFGKWPPPSLSPSSASASFHARPATTQSVISYRDQHYDDVVKRIDDSVGPIARKYFPERSDEERLRKCREFVKAAGELSAELGKHAAGLRVLDKFWFQDPKRGRAFICDDERMKDRLGEEDVNPGEALIVDIVLRPCLLKYGNDKGENYEKSSAWIPALVDLKRSPRSHSHFSNPRKYGAS